MLLPFEGCSPSLGANVFVAPGAVVIGDVALGDQASVWFNSVIRGDVCPIRIGARTNIQDGTIIHVTTDRFATDIGDDVTIGHGAMLHGCTIHAGALIGMRATVLDGAVIGAGAMIGAGSLVTPGKKIPPGVLALGSPARVVRELSPDERHSLGASAGHYVALAARHMASGGVGE